MWGAIRGGLWYIEFSFCEDTDTASECFQSVHFSLLTFVVFNFLYYEHTWASKRFCSVQLLSHVWLLATPWTAALQASLSITNSWSLLMCIELVMASNHLILCRPLLLLPSVFPSIRVFSNESAPHITWPKYWEFQLQNQSFQWTPRTDLL